jgi:hypothetical protein
LLAALAGAALPALALAQTAEEPKNDEKTPARVEPGASASLQRGRARHYLRLDHAKDPAMALDERTRTELEAAVFRRLVEHLRARTDVQNIDLMNLAGFCRNCLSNWMKEAADAKGVPLTKEESREAVYGMPYEEWKAKYQREATAEQKAAFEKAAGKHSQPS